MTTYEDIISTCAENGLDPMDVDRLLVSKETYDSMQESMPSTESDTLLENASDYATIEGPAVRVTAGDEKIIHVTENGIEREFYI